VKKLLIVAVVVILLAVAGGLVADRAAASTAENQITSAVQTQLPGATGVSTEVAEVPVLTQLASGRLRHVTVSMRTLPTGGVRLDDVVVDVHDVTTSTPYTAARVRATASVSTAELSKQLGSDWTLRTDGDALVATWNGFLKVDARIVPSVADGKLTLRLASVTALGVSIDGSQVPSAVTERIDALASSLEALPLGLSLTSVQVTPAGIDVVADGSQVVLGSA
jgi:hypothetical protein